MSRDAWILVHVVGVVLFIGNIVVTAVWKLLADRTRTPAVVAYAQRLVTVTDVAFTATGAALIAISGPILAEDLGGIGGPTWLTVGFALFLASGVIWAAVLIPVQIAQARLARQFRNEGSVPARYWRLAKLWAVFGTVATLLPLANLYLMVVKPDF
ncbi:MAG: DUF2269 domain-containing protein [Actinobacteria bacterium]|nr:DUF2269 domain-containing protein [Actinomycetota bacterium]